MHCIEGQIVHRRSVSREIAFYDLRAADNERGLVDIELLVRTGECDDVEDARKLRTQLRLGNKIVAYGSYQNDNIFLVKQIFLTEKWVPPSPGIQFLPQPYTLNNAPFREQKESQETISEGLMVGGKKS